MDTVAEYQCEAQDVHKRQIGVKGSPDHHTLPLQLDVVLYELSPEYLCVAAPDHCFHQFQTVRSPDCAVNRYRAELQGDRHLICVRFRRDKVADHGHRALAILVLRQYLSGVRKDRLACYKDAVQEIRQ